MLCFLLVVVISIKFKLALVVIIKKKSEKKAATTRRGLRLGVVFFRAHRLRPPYVFACTELKNN